MNPEVLFADNHVVAVNKPAGLAIHCDTYNKQSLTSWVRVWIKQQWGKEGQAFAEPIHRLDKGVSGIVVVAKTSKALSRLTEQIRERRCRKIYWALTAGFWKENSKVLEHYLSRTDFRTSVQEEEDGAKFCRCRCRVLQDFTFKGSPASLVEVELETGRYHQIRAQLSAVGHPIFNDVKYGGPAWPERHLPAGALFLHHRLFEIAHPVKEDLLQLQAPLPNYWPSF
jgi:23S rRNA pseudouridine1911/1915/1917 synthase